MIDETLEAIKALPKNGRLIIDAGGRDEVKTPLTTAKIIALAAELKELREFVGAMRPGSAIFTKGGAILCGGDGNWYTDHHGKFDSAIDAYRKMKAGEGE